MSTETTVRAMTEAFAKGDADALQTLAAEDIVYTVNAVDDMTPYDTDTKGRDAYLGALMKFGADWSVERFEIIDIVVNGDRAATQNAVQMTHREHGQVLETRNAAFWRVRDGQVAEINEFHDSAGLQLARRGGA